jgi:DNA-binding FrmR family transcriptional regulator
MDHEETIQRLKSIEGHVRGIQKMLSDGKYCMDVIGQIQAVQAALTKVSTRILDGHLNSCVIEAVRGDDPNARERVLDEITAVFAATQKT